MIMKYFLVFVVCFQLIIPASIAQKPANIKWGPNLNESRSSNLSRIIGEDETGVYGLRWNNSYGTQKITVERYDKSLKLKKAYKIKLKQKGTDLSFEDIELINGELILFTSYKNRKKKKNFLFAQKISKKSMKLSGKMEIIAEVPEKKRNSAGDFQIEFSQDSTKILVRGSIPYKKGEPEQYQLVVLDKNLNKIWKKNVTLPYPIY